MIELLRQFVALVERNPYPTLFIAVGVIVVGAFRGVIFR